MKIAVCEKCRSKLCSGEIFVGYYENAYTGRSEKIEVCESEVEGGMIKIVYGHGHYDWCKATRKMGKFSPGKLDTEREE
jgi:hypothetical protein